MRIPFWRRKAQLAPPLEAPVTDYKSEIQALVEGAGAFLQRRINEQDGLVFMDAVFADGSVLVGKGPTTKDAVANLTALIKTRAP